MSYVSGIAAITLHEDGQREVRTSDLRVVEGGKPRTLAESGSDPDVWAMIRANKPGTYETLAHFGGATGLLVPRCAIALPDPDFLDQMAGEFGTLGDDALLGAVRTGASAARQFCVDTCGGMFTTLGWTGEALASTLKILPFREDGWVRILLPDGLAQYQKTFDAQHARRWQVTRPDFEQKYETRLTFMLTGNDRFNDEPTLVVFGPLGDCQFIRVARLELEGEGYRFCDGEWRSGERVINQRRPEPEQQELVPALLPLHRQIVATTTVANHPGVPLILQLDQTGQLHPGGMNVFVEGSPLSRRLLSHNPARVLGPHGLGWLA
ncbi:hypothetical protein HY477_02810 [Candidatus Uhrbacteria bacterium]|nr:hypothetical protein [Candidatus Uhrbacteria bacterium]